MKTKKHIVKLSCTLVCSMKASLMLSLTSPCTEVLFHFNFSAQAASSQTLQPLDGLPIPLCDGKEHKTQRKLARATRAVTVNTVHPPRLLSRCSVSMVRLIVHVHPLVIPLHVLKMVSFLLLNGHCSSRTLSSTAQLQWNPPFRDLLARLQRNSSDIPGCGTS